MEYLQTSILTCYSLSQLTLSQSVCEPPAVTKHWAPASCLLPPASCLLPPVSSICLFQNVETVKKGKFLSMEFPQSKRSSSVFARFSSLGGQKEGLLSWEILILLKRSLSKTGDWRLHE